MEAIAAAFGVQLCSLATRRTATYRGHAHTWPAASIEKGHGELLPRHRHEGWQGRLDALTTAEHGMMGSYAIIGAHLPIAGGTALRPNTRQQGRHRLLLRRRHHEHRRVPRGAHSPRCGSSRSSTCARTTTTWSTRRSPTSRRSDRPAADRASAYGLPKPIVVDGNDPDAMYAVAQDAIAKARAGEGPSLIERMDLPAPRTRQLGPGQVPPGGRARPSAGWPRTRSPSAATGRRLLDEGVDAATGSRRWRARSKAKAEEAATYAWWTRRCPTYAQPGHERVGRWRFVMAEMTYRSAITRGDPAGDAERRRARSS